MTTIRLLPFSAAKIRAVLDGKHDCLRAAFVWDISPQGHSFWQALCRVVPETPLPDRARGFLHGLLYASGDGKLDVKAEACQRVLNGERDPIVWAFTWAHVRDRLDLEAGYWSRICDCPEMELPEVAVGFLEGCIAGFNPLAVAPSPEPSPETSSSSMGWAPEPRPIPETKPSLKGPNVTRHYAVGTTMRNPSDTGYNLVSKLVDAREAEGYKLLGRATRSAALMHPERPDEVLRIGRYDGKDATDGTDPADGWLFYYDMLVSQTDDPCAPKVHKIDLFPTHYEVRMERLYEAGREHKRDLSEVNYGRRADVKNKGFAAFIDKVRAAWRTIDGAGWNGGLDLHEGNIMRRADGQIVVTDPFCLFAN